MALPTIPWDKSLHMNYGALIASTFILLACLTAFLVRKFAGITLVLWPIPIVGYVVTYAFGRAKEFLDQRANDDAIAHNQPPPHGVETEDWQKTTWGGAIVCIPVLIVLLV
jgi:hypothetical protein